MVHLPIMKSTFHSFPKSVMAILVSQKKICVYVTWAVLHKELRAIAIHAKIKHSLIFIQSESSIQHFAFGFLERRFVVLFFAIRPCTVLIIIYFFKFKIVCSIMVLDLNNHLGKQLIIIAYLRLIFFSLPSKLHFHNLLTSPTEADLLPLNNRVTINCKFDKYTASHRLKLDIKLTTVTRYDMGPTSI